MKKGALALTLLAVAVGLGWAEGPVAKKRPPCREGALVSVRTGKVLRRFTAAWSEFAHGYSTGPLIAGVAAVSDGRGGWFVAGIGAERLRRDGGIDSHWHAQLPREIGLGAIIRIADRLYVTDGRRVFALDAQSGRRLWVSPVVSHGFHGARPAIEALAANRGRVFIGGAFERVGPAQRTGLAALDGDTGKLLPWPVQLRNFHEGVSVATLAAIGRRLYLGGGFATVNNAQRDSGVASVGVSTGKVTSFNPRVTADNVTAIGVFGHTVFVGGTFGGGAFDARTSASLPRFHAIAVATTISVPVLAKYVSVGSIAVSGEKAFVGGQFCSTLG